MTGIGGCRSSGVLGASAVVSNENAKLISIHAAITIASNAAVKLRSSMEQIIQEQKLLEYIKQLMVTIT